MNRFEENREGKLYDEEIKDAWEKEYQRQTIAYQELQAEMSKLLQILQESQQNQGEFMIETARLFDNCAYGYNELRKEVMSFLNEHRSSMFQMKRFETTASRDTLLKCDEIINKLDQVIIALSQKSQPAAFNRQSDQLIQSSKSGPSPSVFKQESKIN